MSRPPQLSIVVPALNEAKSLAVTLDRILSTVATMVESFEVVVVDDGSTDGTDKIAAGLAAGNPRVRVNRHPTNQGKGAAVRSGVSASLGEYVIFTDADLSTPLEEIAPMMSLLEGGADLVIGSRALPDSRIEVPQRWWREGMGKVFNRLVRLATGLSFPDTQCGFKGFRREAALELFGGLETVGFCFDVEVLLKARELGLRVEELGVRWQNREESAVHPLWSSLEMLWDLARLRLDRRRRR